MLIVVSERVNKQVYSTWPAYVMDGFTLFNSIEGVPAVMYMLVAQIVGKKDR